MKLKTYLDDLAPVARVAFAHKCGTSYGHLRNVSYGQRPCAPELAVCIERHTKGAVTRPELRPQDWRLIWPELAA